MTTPGLLLTQSMIGRRPSVILVVGDSSGNLKRSLNAGASWQDLAASGISLGSMAADGRGAVVAMSATALRRSADFGATWSTVTPAQWGSWTGNSGVAHLPGVGFVAIASNGSNLQYSVSSDGGATWGTAANVGGLSGGYVTCANGLDYDSVSGRLYATATNSSVNGAIVHSANGSTWAAHVTKSSGATGQANGAGGGVGISFLASQEGYYATASGVSLASPNPIQGSSTWRRIVYGGGVHVAVGASDRVSRSTNGGQSWNDANTASAVSYVSACYANGKFYVLESGGKVYASSDGAGWALAGSSGLSGCTTIVAT